MKKKDIMSSSIFVNETKLNNNLIKRGCALTVSSVTRMLYIIIGCVLGILAIVARVFMDATTLAAALVLILGFMLVWQGTRLHMDSARSMIAQLNKVDDAARKRVLFANEQGFGVLINGEPRRFNWDEVKLAVASKEITCLVLYKNSILFIWDNAGFVKGTPEEFLEFLAEHVHSPQRGRFAKWCDKTVYKLDNWKYYRQVAQQQEAARKAERKAAREAARSAQRGDQRGPQRGPQRSAQRGSQRSAQHSPQRGTQRKAHRK